MKFHSEGWSRAVAARKCGYNDSSIYKIAKTNKELRAVLDLMYDTAMDKRAGRPRYART